MLVIYLMSTGLFSAEKTSRIVEPILYLVFPGISQDSVTLVHGLIRKMAHITEYFILGLLLFKAFRGTSQQEWRLKWAVWAVAVAAFYALTDEFHQSFVATRTASVTDVSIDAVGAAMAQLVNIFTYRRRDEKKTVV